MMSDEDTIVAVELYEKGHSLRSIAKKIGHAHTTVWRKVKDIVDMRASGKDYNLALTDREREIRIAYDRGASMGQIGKQHKISRQRVHQILQRTGRSR